MKQLLTVIISLPFLYSAPETDSARLPFLLHAVRMGCGFQESFFQINRDNSYPYFTVHFLFDGCGLFHIAGENYLLKKGMPSSSPPGKPTATPTAPRSRWGSSG